jgi:hypothetical protein
MPTLTYPRTLTVGFVFLVLLGLSFSEVRIDAWQGIRVFFEWMETTWFARIGKTWGGVFAVVEAFDLLGMAMLGGSVLVSDGRLLNLWLKDQPAELVVQQTHRLFVTALVLLISTGIFMACSVAMKIYYMEVYWIKMLALVVGIFFALLIKRPLVENQSEANPWIVRSVAIASLMIWFTVAATGRWIGFSG